MMLRLFAILSMIGLDLTLGEILPFEFIKDTCFFSYGNPISQREEINDMWCVKSCMQHENCTSLMYEESTRFCFLNAEILEDESQFPADCGVKYAVSFVRYFECDEDWHYLAGKCYLFVDKLLTWHGCDAYCLGEKSYLAKLYNYSYYSILYNFAETSWITATYIYYPWINVNDQIEENVYTDRDGVPINSELIPTISNNNDLNDCGRMLSSSVQMYNCDNLRVCLCEKQPRLITRRPYPLN